MNAEPWDAGAFEAEVRRVLAYLGELEPLRAQLLAAEHATLVPPVTPPPPVDPAAPPLAQAAEARAETGPAPGGFTDLKAEIWGREGILAEARPLAAQPAIKTALCAALAAAGPDADLLPSALPALLPFTAGPAPALARDPALLAGIVALVGQLGPAAFCAAADT